MDEYESYDGLGLAELVRNREATPRELLDAAIERTEKRDGDLGAIVLRTYDAARAAIDAGLPEGPFTGVPFLLKDLHLSVPGEPLSNGSVSSSPMSRRRRVSWSRGTAEQGSSSTGARTRPSSG